MQFFSIEIHSSCCICSIIHKWQLSLACRFTELYIYDTIMKDLQPRRPLVEWVAHPRTRAKVGAAAQHETGGGDQIESSYMLLLCFMQHSFFYLQLNFNVSFVLSSFSPTCAFLHPPLHTLSPSLLSGILSPAPQQVAVPSLSGVGGMVRPVTGADMGIKRAEIRPGLREIILCKDQDGKVGLRLRAIDNVSQHYILFDTCVNYLAQTDGFD